ncbi:MAG: OmpA family protein [Terriglobia bacterium]
MKRRMLPILLLLGLTGCLASSMLAQGTSSQAPSVIMIKAVERTVSTVSYRAKSGETKIDFKGTPYLPDAKGEAKVGTKEGNISIEAEFEKMKPASSFGNVYLTYVLWAITPEGRANNLGELQLDGNKGKMVVSTRLQSFGLIVTAEPYFAVSYPSELVVLENIIRKDTKGKVEEVDARVELFKRGQYDDLHLPALTMDPKVPLEYYEAENALRIANSQQAPKYAPDSFQKAQRSLAQAQDYIKRKQNKKSIIMVSREAVQTAEDSRTITAKRIQEEIAANEKKAAADREAKAKAEAEAAEASKRAEAEARRVAEQQRMEAELKAAREATAKAQAEAAQQAALLQEQKAKEEAAKARRAEESAKEAALKAERDKQALRAQLLEQFNRILETRDTPRGLVVTMGDVLFDTGKYDLRPAARERLAKLSGIVLAHPGLRLEIEGYTDSTGSDDFNQKLSEQRAETVRDYLVTQGLSSTALTAKGFGKAMPVASNQTAEGRQKNRRVEMIVSGEVIGTKIGDTSH